MHFSKVCFSGYAASTNMSQEQGNKIPQKFAILNRVSRKKDINKTEKMANKIRKLQEKFIELDNTPPSTKKDRSKKDKINHKKGQNGKDKIVKRKKKSKSNSTKKKKNKLSKLRRKKKTTKNTRYYLENGKYKANKKFESWADNLEKMWKNVSSGLKRSNLAMSDLT